MIFLRPKLFFVPLIAVLIFGCSDSKAPSSADTTDSGSQEDTATIPADATTYHKNIRPLLGQHCVNCHTGGGIAPFDLNSWSAVSQYSGVIVHSVEGRTMPPWAMTDDCRPIKDNMRLSDDEVALFSSWAEDGYLEGKPSDYVSPEPSAATPQAPSLVDPDKIISLPIAYTPDTSVQDDYRCFILPETFEKDRFLYHSELIPDNTAVVHHMIVFNVPEGNDEELATLESEDQAPGYACFGDAGLESASFLVGWAPGAKRIPGTGKEAQRIPAGSTLVMQMHYNFNALTDIANPGTDQSEFAAWYLPEGESPDFLISTIPIANMDFSVDAGDSASTQEAIVRMPVNGILLGTAPHMHLLATDMTTTLIRPDDTEECLADIKNWDFDWQRTYLYEDAHQLSFNLDDRIKIRCTYDNSAKNQPFVGGVQQDPKDIGWGEGSLDEMCLNFLVLATPYTAPDSPGVCGGFQSCFDGCDPGDGMCALNCMGAAGEGCILCGPNSLFGNCLVASCLIPGVALNGCATNCHNVQAGFFQCMYESCRTEFDEYFACVDPLIRNQECAEDFVGCKGIVDQPEAP